MTQNIPSMTRNPIDVLYVIEAHKDLSAIAMMSMMMVFERDISDASERIIQSLKNKEMPKEIVDVLNISMKSAMKLGATDLADVTRRAIDSIGTGDFSRARADALVWTHVAQDARTANIALFQACQLFGRALNGKRLPSADTPSEEG